ncbi:MAG: hypothetical protein KBD51_04030 [Candidatus Levybacteria bacterium]|nr:hypothetical protein [Candidatus Levybacteria bacterium]
MRNEIYKKAIAHFGIKSQLLMAVEEMAELQKALLKYLRDPMNKENDQNILEELADVEITIEQVKLFFHCENEVSKIKEEKIKRLEGLLR